MLKSKIIITVLLSIFFYQSIVQGQWIQSSVIDQGFVSAITVKDSIIFLGGYSLSDSIRSYFYSKDYGNSWTECFNPQASHPNDIVITDDYIFTGEGFEVGYIFRTSDWGLSWEECLAYHGFTALTCYKDTLYAGTSSDWQSGQVWKSTNNGDTWTKIWNGVGESKAIHSLLVMDSLILAGTENSGVYGSSDYGNTWTERNNGLPSDRRVEELILFDNKIFAGVGPTELETNGLFYTTDFGLSWRQFNTGSYIIAFASNGEQLFIATRPKIFLLLKQETEWLDITGDLPDSLFNYSMAVCGDNLFLGTGIDGLWYRSISGITDVKKETGIPSTFSLSQNYPNPFNPTTTIRYELPKAGNVTLKVYNLLGREVATLVSEEKPAGTYEVEFNGSHLASGVYFYHIQAGSFSNTKKFILMK